jgi:hypothetical protein
MIRELRGAARQNTENIRNDVFRISGTKGVG